MESCTAPCDSRAPPWPLLLRLLCSLVADLYHPGDHHERRDGEGVASPVGQGCECWVGGGRCVGREGRGGDAQPPERLSLAL